MSHFSVFRDGNLVISVALRVRVYGNVSMSNDVISERGSTRPDRAIATPIVVIVAVIIVVVVAIVVRVTTINRALIFVLI